jgi:hypothetical protein
MLNEIERGSLVQSAWDNFNRGDFCLNEFPVSIIRIIEEKAWEKRFHRGQIIELPNLKALITERPIKGWGQDPAKIEAVIKDNPEALAMFREAMVEKHGGVRKSEQANIKNDNVILALPEQGNSKAYTVSRLKNNRPDLFEKVVSGELSANAAAIQAGFRKVKTPVEQLNYWWNKCSDKEREEFLFWIGQDT